MKTTDSFLNPLLVKPDRPLPRSVGIIGAGTIGPDISYYLASTIPGLRLVLVDVVQEALDGALQRIRANADKGVRKKKLSKERAEGLSQNLVGTLDYGELSECDWVLEAATENLDLKHKIFAQVEEIVSNDAIITSNTSSLPASRLFTKLKNPSRATVTHFFAPAFRNPAVEVIDWDGADSKTVEYLRWLFCHTGKVPLVTSDAICFMLDRVFDNWCNEAAYLLSDATAGEIDSVATEFVHAGPFFVLNLANGNPIIVETNTLQMEEGEHYRPASILRSVERWVTARSKHPPAAAKKIRDRLLGILFSQSLDILQRDIGRNDDLNLGCQLALGFKKGPFDLMEKEGKEDCQRILARLAEERPGMPAPTDQIPSCTQFPRSVLVDDLDGIKVVTLRRPQAMNALDDAMTDEVLAVLEEHEKDPQVNGFVITGFGPDAFCAGADIGRFPDLLGDAKAAAQFARDCSRLLLRLDAMEKPVVAAVNGMALGGGLELVLRCHSIVASQNSWFQFPEINLGIAPGIGGMVVPFRRWPAAATTFCDMLQTGQRLAAKQAQELGVIDALAEDYEQLIQLATQRVHEHGKAMQPVPSGPVSLPELGAFKAQGPSGQPLSREVAGIIEKAILAGAKAESFNDALEIGYEAFGKSACTAAAKEGISSFLERRKPDFEKTG